MWNISETRLLYLNLSKYPTTTFKIKPNYRWGLTEPAQEMIKERDGLRNSIKRAPTPVEKIARHKKYKK